MTWLTDDLTLFVYVLLDEELRARYVGITVDPKTRARVHKITSRQHYRPPTPVRVWIAEREERVEMLVLEKVEGVRRARSREAHWIDTYLRLGCDLLNTAGMPRQPCLF